MNKTRGRDPSPAQGPVTPTISSLVVIPTKKRRIFCNTKWEVNARARRTSVAPTTRQPLDPNPARSMMHTRTTAAHARR
jgi:hypothetical protein